jgi:hypothetical protein
MAKPGDEVINPDVDDVHGEAWMGLIWTPWVGLEAATPAWGGGAPMAAGLYRLRAHGRPGLAYIGETGRGIRQRLQQLRTGMGYVANGVRVTGAPHVAAGCVLGHVNAGHDVQVSWTVAPDLPRRERKGVECDLIAAHRRVLSASPSCQFAGDYEDETE